MREHHFHLAVVQVQQGTGLQCQHSLLHLPELDDDSLSVLMRRIAAALCDPAVCGAFLQDVELQDARCLAIRELGEQACGVSVGRREAPVTEHGQRTVARRDHEGPAHCGVATAHRTCDATAPVSTLGRKCRPCFVTQSWER